MGIPIKDIDIEVHKISLNQLETILSKFGEVELVGKNFGVLLLKRINVDWSLPRTDNKGRKPEVSLIQNVTLKEAAKRRDLTLNSMAIDLNKLVLNFESIE